VGAAEVEAVISNGMTVVIGAKVIVAVAVFTKMSRVANAVGNVNQSGNRGQRQK